MDSSRFDDLTKALATATSRRQALKTIAATTLGSILGLGGLDTALASNSACAHFCASVFGTDTPAAGQCTSDAAHHKGLCYTCGPASPGGTQPLCCPKNANGYCTSYSSATCCSSGQTCQNGQCVTPCTANGGTCTVNNNCCSGNCTNGQCCQSSLTNCGGTCTDLSSDNNNCGSCGNACASGQTCQNGQCVSTCQPGGTPCNFANSGACCSQACCDSSDVPGGCPGGASSCCC